MQVSLITPYLNTEDAISQRVASQAHFFHGRGDKVFIYSARPPAQPVDSESLPARVVVSTDTALTDDAYFAASELFIFHGAGFYPLLAVLPQLERGAVIFYYHYDPAGGVEAGQPALASLITCVDLVVAEGEEAARSLAERHDYRAAPVHVLPVTAASSAAEYALFWTEAVAAATAWLPNRPYPFGRLPAWEELHPPPRASETTPGTGADGLTGAVSETEAQKLLAGAATAQRDYVVRSRLPIVGPLIAWVRRNLTSHLREPYIDPTFERQESFNRQVAQALATLIHQKGAEQAALEERIRRLEQRLAELSRRSQATGDPQSLNPPAENRLQP